MTTSYDEKRREHGREKKGISMLSSVRAPLCSLVAKSGTELLPPRFSASTSFCFPLPLSLLVLLSPFCPYSSHLSCFFTHHFQLCDPAFPLSAIPLPLSLLSLFPSSFLFLFFCSCFQRTYSAFCSVSIFPLPLSIISLSVSPFPPYCFFPTPSSLLHYSDVHLLFLFLPSPA